MSEDFCYKIIHEPEVKLTQNQNQKTSDIELAQDNENKDLSADKESGSEKSAADSSVKSSPKSSKSSQSKNSKESEKTVSSETSKKSSKSSSKTSKNLKTSNDGSNKTFNVEENNAPANLQDLEADVLFVDGKNEDQKSTKSNRSEDEQLQDEAKNMHTSDDLFE